MINRSQAPAAFHYFAMYTVWGVITPFLSIMIENSGYGPQANGYFLALFNCMGMAGPLVVSPIVDRFGRPRLFLAILCVVAAAAAFPLALSRTAWLTAASIALLAFGMWSMVPVSDAFISKLTRGEAGAYGRVRSMGSVGFIAAGLSLQVLPGFSARSSLSIAFAMLPAAGISLAAIAFLPKPAGERGALPEAGEKGPEAMARTLSPLPSRIKPVFWIGLAVIALGRLSSIPFNSFLSLYVQNRVRWDVVSGMWALGAMAELPFIFASGWFIRKMGVWNVMLLSLGAIVLRLGIYVLFPVPAGVVAGQLLHSLCFGLFFPASVAFVSRTVPEEKRALGMAMNIALGAGIPNLAGNAVGGAIIERSGWNPLFLAFMAPAVAGALAILVFRKPLKESCAL